MHAITRFAPNPTQRFLIAGAIVVGLAGGLAGIAGSLKLVEARNSAPEVCELPPLDSAAVGWIIVLDFLAGRGMDRA